MSKSHKELIISFMKAVVLQLQATDDSQLESLLTGKAQLEFKITHVAKEPADKRKDELPEGFEKNAVEKLHGFSTRDEGERYLEQLCRTKEDLLRIARYLDLPAQKKEPIKQIKDKLIESTIGFRVRSAAVQGTSREPS
ncbi:MAG: hypothetical protein AVO38_11320 [delta proteobacterium ML8_D]|nr:MAG: hypothetical protein AVO38_11320 [delta proteobacterium ML8_D]